MSAYVVSVLIFAGIWAILTVSLNTLTGWAGQVSLGQAAFFAIGAYGFALSATRAQLPFLAALVVGTVAAFVLTGLLGLLALRVRDDFLVFTTIGVNFLVVAVFRYFEVFGGAEGIVALPLPQIGGLVLTLNQVLVLILGLLVLTAAAGWWIRRSWLGQGFVAVRDDERAAQALGIPTPYYKMTAFAISGGMAGLAGGLYASFLGNVFPQNFGFLISIQTMAMLVLGGLGTLHGAILGALLLTALPEILRPLSDYRYTVFGLVLVLIVMFAPAGLTGLAHGLVSRARHRRARLRAEEAAS